MGSAPMKQHQLLALQGSLDAFSTLTVHKLTHIFCEVWLWQKLVKIENLIWVNHQRCYFVFDQHLLWTGHQLWATQACIFAAAMVRNLYSATTDNLPHPSIKSSASSLPHAHLQQLNCLNVELPSRLSNSSQQSSIQGKHLLLFSVQHK